MNENFDPNQFRSVESEEEEEAEMTVQTQKLKLEKSCQVANSKQSGTKFPGSDTQISNSCVIEEDAGNSRFQHQEDFDEDYSDLSDSCDELESHLLKEETCVSERSLQNRYQGFADRLDLGMKEKGRLRDRKDHATTQHVIDRRTQIILFTLMQQKIIHTINGCVSTGKEANVYHAKGFLKDSKQTEANYAVKVYMTSTTSFRDRSQYVTGDYRMRHTASHRRSTYAMVKVWAEKEFRNLSRIFNNGKIAAPRPLKVKGVVLLMEFIGDEDGNAAPRLKDVLVEGDEEWEAMYWEIVRQMRVLFQECGLVHGDLNEYNLLYYNGRPWIIDVSQSVMHEKNPNALLFLRKDVDNVTTFFCSRGVDCLTVRELFNFIVSTAIGSPEEGVASHDPAAEQRAAEVAHLENAKQLAQNRPEDWIWEEAGAFLEEHIPTNLSEVDRPARDIRAVRTGKVTADDLPYASMAGLQTKDFLSMKGKKRLEMKQEREKRAAAASAAEGTCEENIDEEGTIDATSQAESKVEEDTGKNESCKPDEMRSERDDRYVHPTRPRDESPSSRKQRKAEVKGAQREQRIAKKEQRVQWEKKERAKQTRQPKFTRLL